MSIEIIGMVGTQEVSEGFDPLDDVVDWGKELVPMLREQAAAPAGSQTTALSA